MHPEQKTFDHDREHDWGANGVAPDDLPRWSPPSEMRKGEVEVALGSWPQPLRSLRSSGACRGG